ncbi:MAG: hypothetical protein KDK23_05025 [Leptospiraceae bacterium]|nr:hypothetical protein [Leptospiraceae bacterium]
MRSENSFPGVLKRQHQLRIGRQFLSTQTMGALRFTMPGPSYATDSRFAAS